MVTFDELLQALEAAPDSGLAIALPDGRTVPPHFHITEVGYVVKDFFDCGGTRRQIGRCVLQTLVAEDFDHRLRTGKLAKILAKSTAVVADRAVPAFLEHDEGTAAHYELEAIEAGAGGDLLFRLAPHHTACLAPDSCGIPERASLLRRTMPAGPGV